MKIWFMIGMLFLTATCGDLSKSGDSPSPAELSTSPAELSTWKPFYGNGNADNYDVGIIFEAKDANPTQQDYETIMNRLIGTGKRSLFKTIPFKTNKDKFNFYYAILPNFGEKVELKRKSDNHVFTETEIANYRTQAATYLKNDNTNLIGVTDFSRVNTVLGGVFQHLNINKSDIDSFGYMNVFDLDETKVAKTKRDTIRKNKAKFDALFAKKPGLQLKVYISEGVQQDYTEQKGNGAKSVYMDYKEYVNLVIPAASLYKDSDLMGATFTHEFGHAFAYFADEYNPPEAGNAKSRMDTDVITYGFDNNTVKDGFTPTEPTGAGAFTPYSGVTVTNGIANPASGSSTNNPWENTEVPVVTHIADDQGRTKTIKYIPGPVPDYTGTVFLGADGKGGYRTTDGSIMRTYSSMTSAQWPDGWNAVEKFYINYFLEK